jgi:hypothetical protein
MSIICQEESQHMGRLVIGMDPHKRSATIEGIDDREKVLARGRYGTDSVGYQEMLAVGRRFTDRVWAVEGCGGIGPAREDKRERLCDPARTAQSRRTPLRTSHSPDPPATSLKQTHRHPLTRGEPEQ